MEPSKSPPHGKNKDTSNSNATINMNADKNHALIKDVFQSYDRVSNAKQITKWFNRKMHIDMKLNHTTKFNASQLYYNLVAHDPKTKICSLRVDPFSEDLYFLTTDGNLNHMTHGLIQSKHIPVHKNLRMDIIPLGLGWIMITNDTNKISSVEIHNPNEVKQHVLTEADEKITDITFETLLNFIFFVTDTGVLYKYDVGDHVVTQLAKVDEPISVMDYDDELNVVYFAGKRLYSYDVSSNRLVKIYDEGKSINALYLSDGIIYFADTALIKLTPNSLINTTELVNYSSQMIHNFNNDVSCMAVSDKGIFVGINTSILLIPF